MTLGERALEAPPFAIAVMTWVARNSAMVQRRKEGEGINEAAQDAAYSGPCLVLIAALTDIIPLISMASAASAGEGD